MARKEPRKGAIRCTDPCNPLHRRFPQIADSVGDVVARNDMQLAKKLAGVRKTPQPVKSVSRWEGNGRVAETVTVAVTFAA